METEERRLDKADAFLEELSSYKERRKPQRAGGWDYAIVIYLCFLGLSFLNAARTHVFWLFDHAPGFWAIPFDAGYEPLYRALVGADLLYTLGAVAIMLALLWLVRGFLHRKQNFLKYCFRVLLLAGMWNICASVLLAQISPENVQASRSIAYTLIFVIIPAFAIRVYFNRSRRVEETFIFE